MLIRRLLTGAALAVAAGSSLISPAPDRWRGKNSFDEGVRSRIGISDYERGQWARDVSDITVSIAITYPLIFDSLVVLYWYRRSPDVAQQVALISGEALAIAAGLQVLDGWLLQRVRREADLYAQKLGRPIEIGGLLERPEVTGDVAEIARFIQDKVVLATGAGGSIGSELCRQIAQFAPRQLILTDSSEFNLSEIDTELRQDYGNLDIVTRIVDVRDDVRASQLFAAYRPQVIFHAAALKHVPLAEDNPLEALKTNVIGTRNVADAAQANDTAVFVMISTDKAVNPTSVMGATKRAAEAYCQALDVNSRTTRFKTVRFGNVLGSNGSVVPRFEEQIAAGGPVTVTDPDITRYFMTIPEAVGLVLHASGRSSAHPTGRGDIMVLDMGKPVRVLDLAERMIQLAGYRPRVDIDIVFTGLRPGEKLYEEMFDPSEVRDNRTMEGFFIASPRITDHSLLRRTMDELAGCLKREDVSRALDLLAHVVPEYSKRRDAVDGYPQEAPRVRKPNLVPPSG